MNRLSDRLKALERSAKPNDPKPILSFDKDDDDTLDFVTAAANMRATVFRIDCKSKFDVKREFNSQNPIKDYDSDIPIRDGW